MDDSQHQQYLQLTSSSTLLQTSGGTLLTLDDLTASSSGAAGIPSPMQHAGQQKSAENSQSQGSKYLLVILENDFSNTK